MEMPGIPKICGTYKKDVHKRPAVQYRALPIRRAAVHETTGLHVIDTMHSQGVNFDCAQHPRMQRNITPDG